LTYGAVAFGGFCTLSLSVLQWNMTVMVNVTDGKNSRTSIVTMKKRGAQVVDHLFQALTELYCWLPVQQLLRLCDVRSALVRIIGCILLEDNLCIRIYDLFHTIRQLNHGEFIRVANIEGPIVIWIIHELHESTNKVVNKLEATCLLSITEYSQWFAP
jgi:hypothetical protein